MNDIRSLDLNLLRALSVLLVERNVTRAAKILHVTQPTVSGMLARLRDIFDDPLFVRTSHGLLPTPRALEIEPAVLALIRDAEALVSSEEFDPAESTATTMFSVNDYMQSAVMVPLLSDLRSSAPNMKIGIRNLEVSGLSSMLMRGDIDMAITIPEFADDSLRTQFLYREEYVAVVRASHPIRSSRVSLKRFLSFDHLLVSPASGAFAGPADEVLNKLGRSRRVAVSVPSFHVLTEILREDDFITFLPSRLYARQSKALRKISAPIEVPGFDVIVAWHSRANNDPTHQWLRTRLDVLSHDATGVA